MEFLVKDNNLQQLTLSDECENIEQVWAVDKEFEFEKPPRLAESRDLNHIQLIKVTSKYICSTKYAFDR